MREVKQHLIWCNLLYRWNNFANKNLMTTWIINTVLLFFHNPFLERQNTNIIHLVLLKFSKSNSLRNNQYWYRLETTCLTIWKSRQVFYLIFSDKKYNYKNLYYTLDMSNHPTTPPICIFLIPIPRVMVAKLNATRIPFFKFLQVAAKSLISF